jgi:hypothetical protein
LLNLFLPFEDIDDLPGLTAPFAQFWKSSRNGLLSRTIPSAGRSESY